MNLNSAHQVWSKWTFTVTPGRTIATNQNELERNCGRFGRAAFGGASQMRVRAERGKLIVEIRTEGHPVHEAPFVEWMHQQWTTFFINAFGVGTRVALEAKLEAGSRQDGRPSAQLVILPSLSVH